jgi:hypothetical protein
MESCRWCGLQKNFVADIQHLFKAFSHFFTDWAFSVFHLANMSLRDSVHFRKLNLRQSFPVSCTGQDFADELPFRIFGVCLTPRDQIGSLQVISFQDAPLTCCLFFAKANWFFCRAGILDQFDFQTATDRLGILLKR